MKYSETNPEVDTAIARACTWFVAQVRPVIPVDSLAVVLLDEARETSRVVFSWREARQPEAPDGESLDSQPPLDGVDCAALRVDLEGSKGILGAVLIRSRLHGACGPEQKRIAKYYGEQLTRSLENIGLKQLLKRNQAETLAFQRIAEMVSSQLPATGVYRRFASEVKQFADFQRLSIFLASSGTGRLTCDYQVGLGAGRRQSREICEMAGAWCEQVMSSGRSYIVGDHSQTGAREWRKYPPGGNLRSALLVPIEHAGRVIGAVALENRHPNAYGPAEERLLNRAAMLLGPVANAIRYSIPGPGPEPGHGEPLQPPKSLPKDRLTDVAHALRTPLAAIKGYSSALLQTDVTWPAPVLQEFLETIDRETDRLSQVVGELLDPARADGGDSQLNLAVSSVQSLFDQARSELAETPLQQPVDFHCGPGLSQSEARPVEAGSIAATG